MQRSQDKKILGWSQVFRLCDQEELPCCETCVKVPYQSHIGYSECESTSAVPATQLLLGTDVLKAADDDAGKLQPVFLKRLYLLHICIFSFFLFNASLTTI